MDNTIQEKAEKRPVRRTKACATHDDSSTSSRYIKRSSKGGDLVQQAVWKLPPSAASGCRLGLHKPTALEKQGSVGLMGAACPREAFSEHCTYRMKTDCFLA